MPQKSAHRSCWCIGKYVLTPPLAYAIMINRIENRVAVRRGVLPRARCHADTDIAESLIESYGRASIYCSCALRPPTDNFGGQPSIWLANNRAREKPCYEQAADII
eukprot:scaffold7_cov142-Skeletonema_menzelii.AAC.11